MRWTALVGLAGLLVAASAPRPASAREPQAYRAIVSDPEVKLRAGPSDKYPETGALKHGAEVVVEREEANGWLAIAAPKGSVSWIGWYFVQDLAKDSPTPKNGLVEGDVEVTLAAGKAGLAQPLEVRREKLPQGTIVLLIGQPVKFAGKMWWPIEPPAGDVRYIPKTAVRLDKPLNNNVAVRVTDTGGPVPPGASPSASGVSPLATVPGAGKLTAAGGVSSTRPAVNHPLWAQAEAAERDGRLADAEKLYFELAAIMNGKGGDHDAANLCYTRIHAIRERKRSASAGIQPTRPDASRVVPLKTNVLQPPASERRGVRPGTPTPLPAGTGNATGEGRAHWTGPGTIRRTVLTPGGSGKPAYALETAPGVVKAYVSGGEGVDMEKFLGQRVEVYGETNPSRLSKPFIIASKVEPVQ